MFSTYRIIVPLNFFVFRIIDGELNCASHVICRPNSRREIQMLDQCNRTGFCIFIYEIYRCTAINFNSSLDTIFLIVVLFIGLCRNQHVVSTRSEFLAVFHHNISAGSDLCCVLTLWRITSRRSHIGKFNLDRLSGGSFSYDRNSAVFLNYIFAVFQYCLIYSKGYILTLWIGTGCSRDEFLCNLKSGKRLIIVCYNNRLLIIMILNFDAILRIICSRHIEARNSWTCLRYCICSGRQLINLEIFVAISACCHIRVLKTTLCSIRSVNMSNSSIYWNIIPLDSCSSFFDSKCKLIQLFRIYICKTAC